MRGIIEFAKKNSWVWIIIIVLIAIIGDAFLTQNRKVPPSPTPAAVASFNSVVPGVSSESDLNKILGTPLKSTSTDGVTTDEYKSKSPVRNSVGIIENGKVVLIKQIVAASENTKSDFIVSTYGNASNVLFSKAPNAVFNLYVYPANGIAYLGASDGTVLEIWYFIPTTIDNFINLWGKDYQVSRPEPVQ